MMSRYREMAYIQVRLPASTGSDLAARGYTGSMTLRSIWRPAAIAGLLALNLALTGDVRAASMPPQSGPAADAPDVTKLGPQVGAGVPDFTLADQRGRTHTLSSLMGPKGLVLVFLRSAAW
jgi:hypothetical protein